MNTAGFFLSSTGLLCAMWTDSAWLNVICAVAALVTYKRTIKEWEVE